MYFCPSCRVNIEETRVREHDQSTAHLLASTKAPTLKKVWIPESNRGYQLLMSMGWKENSGLGPQANGHIEPIKTTFKTTRAGIGMKTQHSQACVTHFPAHNVQQALRSHDGLSDADSMQVRLDTRKRKQQQSSNELRAQRKARLVHERQRERVIPREIYCTGLEGYELY